MNRQPSLKQTLESQIDDLAATLQPNTIASYRLTLRRFIRFLEASYPQVSKPSHLRRDPHILGFLRSLHQQRPPLKNGSRLKYLINLRRLLDDLACSTNRRALQGLLAGDDLPPLDIYLPKPLSPEDDQLLDRKLCCQNDLLANALLLLRVTGMRIGEGRNLTVQCLHCVGPDQWALKVPLGKLHTERWLPVDDRVRQIISRLLALRPTSQTPFLLMRPSGKRLPYESMRSRLAEAALQAGCSSHITPHQLRHSYATEMIRAGVSLPVLMQLLGHKSIRMTMRYVQVSPNDVHEQYHQARCRIASKHLVPTLPRTLVTQITGSNAILALRNSLAATHHLLSNYRLQLSDIGTRQTLARLANRLAKISGELAKL